MKPLKTAAFAAIFALSAQSALTQADPVQQNLPYDKFGQTAAEKKLIKESWDAACTHSGLCKTKADKNGHKNVPTYVVNSMMFIQLNCSDRPSACMRMASTYNSDYKSIFIQDNARPDKNVHFQSVLVHEFVHAQQEKLLGGFEKVNATCTNLLSAEVEAYRTQNKFLKSKGITNPEEGKKFLSSFICEEPTFPKLFVANNDYIRK